jgi:hypothetical protein
MVNIWVIKRIIGISFHFDKTRIIMINNAGNPNTNGNKKD